MKTIWMDSPENLPYLMLRCQSPGSFTLRLSEDHERKQQLKKTVRGERSKILTTVSAFWVKY